MNEHYQKMYSTWKSMKNLRYERIHRIELEWQEYILGIAKKMFPKRKIKDINKAFDLVGEDAVEELKTPWLEKAKEVYDKYGNFEDALGFALKNCAKDYIIYPSDEVSHKLKTSNGGDHRSQGFGANKYAKADLQSDRVLLECSGYKTEIRETNLSESDRWGVRYATYELWANITELDFQMLKWKGEFISVLNWAVICWRNQTNPSVFFPFLSDKDYEESQKLAYDTSYVITKENMKLEPNE